MTSWQNKVALITGGSSGLGRAIAEAFAAAGCRVVIAARNEKGLDDAAEAMRRDGHEVLNVPADITRQVDVDRLIARCLESYGRLDVLVNNAGRSMRRAVAETSPNDFRELMELNFFALVGMTQAALPHLVAQHGHLVNIGSLAGKSAARFVGAYPATKFAVTAYSQQLRLELGPSGLHVLLVCPGPIARSTPRGDAQLEARGRALAGLPEAARRPGAGVRVAALQPDWLARRIVRACERRQGELIYPASARLVFALMQLSPRLADWLVRVTT